MKRIYAVAVALLMPATVGAVDRIIVMGTGIVETAEGHDVAPGAAVDFSYWFNPLTSDLAPEFAERGLYRAHDLVFAVSDGPEVFCEPAEITVNNDLFGLRDEYMVRGNSLACSDADTGNPALASLLLTDLQGVAFMNTDLGVPELAAIETRVFRLDPCPSTGSETESPAPM